MLALTMLAAAVIGALVGVRLSNRLSFDRNTGVLLGLLFGQFGWMIVIVLSQRRQGSV